MCRAVPRWRTDSNPGPSVAYVYLRESDRYRGRVHCCAVAVASCQLAVGRWQGNFDDGRRLPHSTNPCSLFQTEMGMRGIGWLAGFTPCAPGLDRCLPVRYGRVPRIRRGPPNLRFVRCLFLVVRCVTAVLSQCSGESGDALEGAREDRGRRQRRLDGKITTCPEMGRASSTDRQSVEAPGQVCGHGILAFGWCNFEPV